MARFYFRLSSHDSWIPDDKGKELNDMFDAYLHARNLINQILHYVGADDSSEWKVVISNDTWDALLIIPFPKAIDDWSWSGQSTEIRSTETDENRTS